MTKSWFWSSLWILFLTAALQGQSRDAVLKAVAGSPSWTPADKAAQYDSKNIEKFDRRESEILTRYGVIGVTRQTWKNADANIRMTLYEMADPSAAYGLFTLKRDSNRPDFMPLPLGSEGFRLGNRSIIWQSKYVVDLEGNAAAADDLARIASESIFGRSRKPPVSTHLPPANLMPASEKYIIDEQIIGRELGVKPTELGLEDSVEAATADYHINGKLAHLVLLLYPTQQIAKKFSDQLATMPGNDPAFRKRVGPLLAIVRGTRDAAVAGTLLDGLNYESQVTWNQPRPDISLRDVILTIFSFIGVALLFTIVVGFSFGGIRILAKARYPGRVFDRPEEMEIIQLKLIQSDTRKELKG